jgi:hypothetical protein
MTQEQWLFEYNALLKKEEEEVKLTGKIVEAHLRGTRNLLVNLLGLNLFVPEDQADRDFMPLVGLVGHPEMLKFYQEQAKRRADEDAAGDDEIFDQFSEHLLRQLKMGDSDLRGDMVPLLTDELGDIERNSYWNSEELQQQLTALGVKPRGEPRTVPHVKARPKYLERGGVELSDDQLMMAGEKPRDGNPLDFDPAEIEKFKRALGGDD